MFHDPNIVLRETEPRGMKVENPSNLGLPNRLSLAKQNMPPPQLGCGIPDMIIAVIYSKMLQFDCILSFSNWRNGKCFGSRYLSKW